MLLVPRQLQRSGMTGNVPYYGGRLTPAQAYAASHPTAPLPPSIPTNQEVLYGRTAVPGAGQDNAAALQQLLSAGVITQAEFDQLRQRVR